MIKFMRNLQNDHSKKDKLGRKYFNFRMVDQDLSTEMTGYPHNGVTPFLLGDQIQTVLVSHNLDEGVGEGPWTRAMWLGGGNKDVKMSKYRRIRPVLILSRDLS